MSKKSRPMTLGDYYPYMVIQNEGSFDRPTSSTECPLYIGTGPQVPTEKVFTNSGRTWVTRWVLEVGHPLNPFSVPLIHARLRTKAEADEAMRAALEACK